MRAFTSTCKHVPFLGKTIYAVCSRMHYILRNNSKDRLSILFTATHRVMPCCCKLFASQRSCNIERKVMSTGRTHYSAIRT